MLKKLKMIFKKMVKNLKTQLMKVVIRQSNKLMMFWKLNRRK